MPEHDGAERQDLLDLAISGMLAGASEPPGSDLNPLVRIARALRAMPSEDFQSRLRTELQRSATMSTSATAIKPVREGFRTITPYLTNTEGAKLVDFLKDTFGAQELLRTSTGGGFHAEVRIGDSMLMVGSGEQVRGHEKIGAFHIYVPDCDAAFQRALEAGATSQGEPADRPYGERSGFVTDFAGNHWYISTRFASAPAREGLGAVLPFVHLEHARPYLDFLKGAFGAEELGVFEHGGKVVHAGVRIGDAVLEMGESHAPTMPSRFFLYVEDCDAWYAQAIAAGATSIQPPADQPYHHRTAVVLDPQGHEWIPASLIA
jgi:PhnB protein